MALLQDHNLQTTEELKYVDQIHANKIRYFSKQDIAKHAQQELKYQEANVVVMQYN